MKVNYQDLIKYLSDKPSKELLSEKLFQLGHEHEIHEDIFDMELTPNRGDCQSCLGLSRDLNIFFGASNALDIFEGDIEQLDIDFKNFAPKDCPKVTFLEIEIEEVSDSYQPYLANYLSCLDKKKTNIFTDISNYISYEIGQPTHCYNSDNINSTLIFENKECNDKFMTLLGSEINLTGQNCVFSLDDAVISLAGVMGGASTACSNETKKVLVECAYFNPESIIGKSIKYNLKSDAAHKFERGVDIAAQEYTLRRFIKIVEEHAKIKTVKMKSFSENDLSIHELEIDINKINKILGTQLNEEEYLIHLKGLGFKIKHNIAVPSYRNDIKTQNDLAEEIARVIGYNNIKNSPINIDKSINETYDLKLLSFRSYLIENGFYEVINFPFSLKKENESIVIDNPLDSNRKNLRTSIKDSLVSNLLYNERRQQDSIKLFEVSDIYTKNPEIKYKKKLGLIISGRRGDNYKDFSKKLDYEYLDRLLNVSGNDKFFNINEILRDDLDTKKKNKIFYVEFNVDEIPDIILSIQNPILKDPDFSKYTPISEYPHSTRDFSFSINNINVVNEVVELLNNISDEIIKDSFLFDFYKNNKTNTVKLGYRFVFQSQNKTLSDIEINKKVTEIIAPILELDGVIIPGMMKL